MKEFQFKKLFKTHPSARALKISLLNLILSANTGNFDEK